MSSLKVHIVDDDSGRRAQIAFSLSKSRFHAQVYEDVDELHQLAPRSGLILLSDDMEHCPIGELLAGLPADGRDFQVVLYSSDPKPCRIVNSIYGAASDYFAWPFGVEQVRDALARRAEHGFTPANTHHKSILARKLVDGLSRRERETLIAMVSGHSSRVVSEQLGISCRTAEIHRSNVIKKLKIKSSLGAVKIGVYAGLDRD